ncbi:hypothetical protein ACQ4PT_052874 [Festuca glaucescens]
MAPVHVLVFPWPLQGHINSMLHFAAGLLGAGLHVSFVHTEHNLRRVDRAKAAASPRLRLVSVPDGLPDDHPRSVDDLKDLAKSLMTTGTVPYRALLASMLSAGSRAVDAVAADGGFPPLSCVVADGLLPFANDIAEELGVPALAFRTASACSVLAYLSVPKLMELGAVPIPVGADLDEPARALICNSPASLEGSALAHIARLMRDVFAIGPIHAMSAAPALPTSLWREDDGCMAWLDGHADRSVVYVSLGSLAVISLEQFTEFLSGLVGAGYAFLWVLRPDMVGESQRGVLQEAIHAAGNDKVRVVDWAPQRDVLRHRAMGCFLTHAGWNSTLEGIVEGVPLVCWPFFADQQINSRFVGAVWGNGLDMKDVCERAIVEGMVKEAMESGELRMSAQALAQQVRRDVAEGGSSATEFERLVCFIKELTVKAATASNTV